MRFALPFLAVTSLLAACDSDVCDRDTLVRQLQEAMPGDVVSIGECRIPGGISVPAGVTLEGVGRTTSAIEALPGNYEALVVNTRAGLVTTVRRLSVEGRGVAIEVSGDGEVRIEEARIDVEAGWGVALDGIPEAVLHDVEIQGPIDADNADDAQWVSASMSDTGWIGIRANAVGMLRLDDVAIDGMAWAGLVCQGGVVDADSLSVTHTLGYGVILDSTEAVMNAVEIAATYQGLRGEPSIALVADASTVTVRGLSLSQSARYGVVARGGRLDVEDLEARGGGDAALWVGGAEALRLGGSNIIADTRFAGAVIVDSRGVDIHDLQVENTATSVRNVGAGDVFGMIELGDGLHLLGDLSGAVFEDVRLLGNARAGLVVELGVGSAPTFRGVSVEADLGALGAVAGRAAPMPLELVVGPEPGWDEGIARDAEATVNDASFTGTIDVARVEAPAELP